MSAKRTKIERIEAARDAVNAATEDWLAATAEVQRLEDEIAAATTELTIALAKAQETEASAANEVAKATRLLEGA